MFHGARYNFCISCGCSSSCHGCRLPKGRRRLGPCSQSHTADVAGRPVQKSSTPPSTRPSPRPRGRQLRRAAYRSTLLRQAPKARLLGFSLSWPGGHGNRSRVPSLEAFGRRPRGTGEDASMGGIRNPSHNPRNTDGPWLRGIAVSVGGERRVDRSGPIPAFRHLTGSAHLRRRSCLLWWCTSPIAQCPRHSVARSGLTGATHLGRNDRFARAGPRSEHVQEAQRPVSVSRSRMIKRQLGLSLTR